MGMTTTLMKAGQQVGELTSLRDLLVEEQKRLEGLLRRVEETLQNGTRRRAKSETGTAAAIAAPRPSPLDKVRGVTAATADLRVANGNISADRVAKLYGVSMSQLAGWLGRTRQAVGKTPDADSLQSALGYFERVARLRLMTKTDAEFRKWLRASQELLGNEPPLKMLAKGEWQALADYVDDALTGAPT